jgi:hypothetical protein
VKLWASCLIISLTSRIAIPGTTGTTTVARCMSKYARLKQAPPGRFCTGRYGTLNRKLPVEYVQLSVARVCGMRNVLSCCLAMIV